MSLTNFLPSLLLIFMHLIIKLGYKGKQVRHSPCLNTHRIQSKNLSQMLSLLQSYMLYWCFKEALCLKPSEVLVILQPWQSVVAFTLSPPLTPFPAWPSLLLCIDPLTPFPFYSLGHGNSHLSVFLFLLLNFRKMLICFKCIPSNLKFATPLCISC